MKIRDMSVAILIVAIVLIMIVPIPAGILDVLLALNIAISLVILLNVIYSKEPLQLSIFPSLLLITTIYRLALNIKSTWLVLSVGEAGDVIQGFGEFITNGNIVVGFIIFLIIMVVQFMVITKGTERVSEVAARFTLDAMPGKQMAIDADLNAGIINEGVAKERRQKIQREADFYGAMDGATKFVKGDAIAGIIITILNVVGGLIIGIAMRGEDLGFAVENYTKLTIGDGLVSQIPALLISISTGLIVTRAASDEGLSDDLFKQMLQNPRVYFIAAGFSIVVGFMLGVAVPFTILAIVFIFVGINLMRKQQDEVKLEETKIEESEVEEIRKPENVVNLLQVDPIELEFGYGIIPLADVNQGGDLLDRVVMIRRQLALELGMIVPVIRLRDNIQLSPNEYVIKIKGVEITNGELMLDYFLAMNPGNVEEEISGISTTEPAFGLPAVWVTQKQRDRAEMLGYTVVDPPSIIATHLTEVIKQHAHELMGRQEIQTIINKVKENNPAIVEELLPKMMTLGEIQKVVANLLKEGVSIRDFVTILEALADNAQMTRDTDLLTEYVRQALGRAISKKFMREKKSNVLTLDPNLEQIILDSVQKTETGSYISIEPHVTNSIIKNLSDQIQKLLKLGQQPIVLASPIVRLYFKRLIDQAVPGIIVLSYNELDPQAEIQSVGMVSI
jgi:flagellar biosynthesis protein FlhA